MEHVWFKHYDKGVPEQIILPEKSIADMFKEIVKKYPENTALVFMGTRMTYTELSDLVDNFTAALAGLGVKNGSRVAIHLPNCPQFVISYLATLNLGATVVPCNPMYVERELTHQLNDSGCEVIVTLSRFYELVNNIKPNSQIKTIIVCNIKDYFPSHLRLLYTLFKEQKEGDRVDIELGDVWFKELLKKYNQSVPPIIDCDMDSPACYLYTGGTTGVSKGAILTHNNLASNAVQTMSWMPDYEIGKEKTLAVLPFFHSFGLTTCLNLSLLNGGSLILLPRFELDMLLKALDKEKPTLFPGVPTIYVAIINAPNLGKYDLSSLKACISGAAPLAVEVQKKFEALSGGKLVEGYGLTESSPVTHANPVYGNRKAGSIGIPFPNTIAKIVDLEDPHKEMPLGEEGQLAITGPQIMEGYLNRPEETAQAMLDGWLLTGDIAKMDEDGYFYIVDRKKDMVIAGGFNIFPREIEEVLFTHEKIREATVAGIPDQYRGETIKAYVVLKEGETMNEKEVINFCKENLAKYKVPSQVEFREELPKTMIGKVLRRVLVEEELAKQNLE